MPYRSPEWVRETSRQRTMAALYQLSGNRQMSAKVPYQNYLEAMDEPLSDALESGDGYAAEELTAISNVRRLLRPVLDSRADFPDPVAISELEACAGAAFAMMAEDDGLAKD